jgi:rubrerythrin
MPQVTNTPELGRRPKYKRRRREMDEYASLPTKAEILEGKAYTEALRFPSDEGLQRYAKKLWWQLEDEARANGEKWTPSTRCPWCHTLRYHRPMNAPCAVCGHLREAGE